MIIPDKFADKRNEQFRKDYDAGLLPIILGSLAGATAVRVLFPGLMESMGAPIIAFMLTAAAVGAVLCLLRGLLRKLFRKIALKRKQSDADEDGKE